MSKIKIAIILSAALLLGGGAVWLWIRDKNKSDINGGSEANLVSSPEEFEREGTVFSNTSYHNFEVIELPDGRYRMFFHEGTNLRSAISDDGRNFTLEEGVRLNASMPAFVALPEGGWRLYFVEGAGSAIKSAVTEDGFNLVVEAGTRLLPGNEGDLDQGGVIHPTVTRLPDGSFKMFYDGVSSSNPDQSGPGVWHITSAKSADGFIWEKEEGERIETVGASEDNEDEDDESECESVEVEDAWSSHVEYADGQYILYFTAAVCPHELSGIWKATSTDGLNFTLAEAPSLKTLEAESEVEGDLSQMGGPPGSPQDPFILHLPTGDRLFYWTSDGGILSAFRKE